MSIYNFENKATTAIKKLTIREKQRINLHSTSYESIGHNKEMYDTIKKCRT